MELSVAALIEACGDGSQEGGLLIEADLEPIGGSGSPVKPAIYSQRRYQVDQRWVGTGPDRHVAQVVVIDNFPSQANRLEAALEALREELGLPEIVLDLSAVGELPPHLPRAISGFRFPHRQADAYLRDALVDGLSFMRSDIGRSLMAASADDPAALFEWFPQALLFGFWQSHLGPKRSQAKLARSWVSEIVGISPADVTIRTMGIKGDPLNLNSDEQVAFDKADPSTWTRAVGTKRAAGKKDGLSKVGHGQVPFPDDEQTLSAVSCEWIEQRATVSFASLRRIDCADSRQSAAGRALLAALGIVAHVSAFGRPFSLRSGCDLRPTSVRWRWLGGEVDADVAALDRQAAIDLFAGCVAAAEQAGLPVGGSWAPQPLVVSPQPNVAKAIRDTYPEAD